jgi:hypothetical protein
VPRGQQLEPALIESLVGPDVRSGPTCGLHPQTPLAEDSGGFGRSRAPVPSAGAYSPGGLALARTSEKGRSAPSWAEIFAAEQEGAQFNDLDTMRQDLFIAEHAEFPAIGGALGLQAAAANTQATFDEKGFWAMFIKIAGSLAGLVNPAARAALAIAGDIVAMIPSATPSTTSKYATTYAGVQDQFADSVSDADKAKAEMSQTVRQDYGLLALVARLREQGTWQPDLIGVTSAGNQAFATWVHQSLLPAVYTRYEITDCVPTDREWGWHCYGPSTSASYPGVLGTANGPTFTALGPPTQKDWTGHQSVPCDAGFLDTTCN